MWKPPEVRVTSPCGLICAPSTSKKLNRCAHIRGSCLATGIYVLDKFIAPGAAGLWVTKLIGIT